MNAPLGACIIDAVLTWRLFDPPTPLSHSCALSLMYKLIKPLRMTSFVNAPVCGSWSMLKPNLLTLLDPGAGFERQQTEKYTILVQHYFYC